MWIWWVMTMYGGHPVIANSPLDHRPLKLTECVWIVPGTFIGD